ncbi:MAG: hypothetical protein K4H23_04790 [Mollicutes bacterium PWAP]|nr:hypothetical protein [Mollicutes bacterium PWAP]
MKKLYKAIIVADENEIKKINLKVIETKKIFQFNFKILENNIIFVHSGIGVVNAGAAMQSLIENFNILEIWNYGAVGAYKNHEIYEVVIPKKFILGDVTTPWYPQGQTPGELPFYKNNIKQCSKTNIVTTNSFIFEEKVMKNFKNNLNSTIFDMETAAYAQIAFKNNIPFNVVKCVSDVVGSDVENNDDINNRIKKSGLIAYKKMIELI